MKETKILKDYGTFDWKSYLNKNTDLNFISSSKEAYQHLLSKGLYEDRIIYFFNSPQKFIENLKDNQNIFHFFEIDKLPDDHFESVKINNLNISFEKFDWNNYLKINKDLIKDGIHNKALAWHHWNHSGKFEERAFSFINNTNIHEGRFGNIFFLNLFLHFYASKFDLACTYKYHKKFHDLGISLYRGKNTFQKNFLLNEENHLMFFDSQLQHLFEPANIIIHNNVWLHNSIFCLYLKNYFFSSSIRNKIEQKNIFKSRYNSNNDLFIHLRLDDVANKTSKLLEYYEKTIQSIDYSKAYISSDSMNHEIIHHLIQKYKLIPFQKNDIETIMFANTCKKLILSGGTYSWLLGFFAFYASHIFYPIYEKPWFGNIFDTDSSWIPMN